LKRSGNRSIGTAANLVVATAAGVFTIVITQASIIVLMFLRKIAGSYFDVLSFSVICQLRELFLT